MKTLMNNKVVCSICSRAKDDDKNLLPARKRYVGSHIAIVENNSKELGQPFYILSGLYGFISGDELIPDYDYLLDANRVPALVAKVTSQLLSAEVGEVRFYTKRKPNWEPYLLALTQATDTLGVKLTVKLLGDDD
jgi:hypothetical protein